MNNFFKTSATIFAASASSLIMGGVGVFMALRWVEDNPDKVGQLIANMETANLSDAALSKILMSFLRILREVEAQEFYEKNMAYRLEEILLIVEENSKLYTEQMLEQDLDRITGKQKNYTLSKEIAEDVIVLLGGDPGHSQEGGG